jgi:hypothetical protein
VVAVTLDATRINDVVRDEAAAAAQIADVGRRYSRRVIVSLLTRQGCRDDLTASSSRLAAINEKQMDVVSTE